MSRKLKLLTYLREKGFELIYDLEFIVCLDNNNQFKIKRNRFGEPDYRAIEFMIYKWGYDTSDFEEKVMTKRKRKHKNREQIIEKLSELGKERNKTLNQTDLTIITAQINTLNWVLNQ